MSLGIQFKMVTLDCPYDQWDDPEVQELFVKTIQLKFKGYRKEYPYGVLPVDTTDFVGTHHIVCMVTDSNKLQPVMAYRSVYLDRCRTHNLPFPVLSMVKALGLTDHILAVEDKILCCEKKNLKLSYDSSWTIDPEFRRDKEIAGELHKMMNAMHVLFHMESKTDHAFIGGALRFKMDRYFGKWGYQPLELNSQPLPGFELPSFFNEKIRLLYLENGFTSESIEAASQYQSHWQNRIILSKKEIKELERTKEDHLKENIIENIIMENTSENEIIYQKAA